MMKLSDCLKKTGSFFPKTLRLPRIVLSWQNVLLILALLLIPVLGFYLWKLKTTVPTLETALQSLPTQVSKTVAEELRSAPSVSFRQEKDTFIVTDEGANGIKIEYPNKPKGDEQKQNEPPNDILKLTFPNDYATPIGIDLGQGMSFTLADQGAARGYRSELIDSTLNQKQDSALDAFTKKRVDEMKKQAEKDKAPTQDVLSYRSPDNRKTILYSYRVDQAQGAKKLKSWTIYAKGTGTESETYVLDGATARINDAGDLEVFLVSEQDLRNDAVKSEVDGSLLERAQKTLAREANADIMNGKRAPDLSIPKPYFVDKDGNRHGADWTVSDDGKTLSVSITDAVGLYPIALDPTFMFSLPGQNTGGDTIMGTAGENFSRAMTAGDFNSDGRMDLVASCGDNICLYYNDGLYSSDASGADKVIVGNSYLSGNVYSLIAGDFNADGKTDIAFGDQYWSASGRVSILYQGNGGSWPSGTDGADAVITNGEVNGSNGYERFGSQLAVGDFNADGRSDLAVASPGYDTDTGRVYVFYQESSWPTSPMDAEAILTGENEGDQFGGDTFSATDSLAVGDFNDDGVADLAAGAAGYYLLGLDGKAYVFYGGSITTGSASDASVVLSGNSDEQFGTSVAMGDFNADGKTDLAVSAGLTGAGYLHIFYSDGALNPTDIAASAADVTISDVGGYTGPGLSVGDFNADGRTDIATWNTTWSGSYYYSVFQMFYNDGSYPADGAHADVVVNSEAFSWSATPRSSAIGDFNSDGKTDIALGISGYASGSGRVYLLYSQNGMVNTNRKIAGPATDGRFGSSLTAGDFNSDGRMDLAVSGWGSSGIYIFYNDGSIPTAASSADDFIASNFGNGFALVSGDFNNDGKTDLALGEAGYFTAAGLVSIIYNDGTWPADTSLADEIIANNPNTHDYFGHAMVAGDFDADGDTDLAVGAQDSSGESGIPKTYVFYNDGSWPTDPTGASAVITGCGGSDDTNSGLATGDFNADGKTDLMVGNHKYSSNTGQTYIFYNGSITTENASGADVIITGDASSNLGGAVSYGDFNNDGKDDIAVSASNSVYIYYSQGSSNPAALALSEANVTISDVGGYNFPELHVADLNVDGRADIVVGNVFYDGMYRPRTYVFYSDGSYPTSGNNADITISGEEITPDAAPIRFTSGDFDSDGRTDLVIGESGHSVSASGDGAVYFYTARDNFSWMTHASGLPGMMNTSPGAGQEVRIVGEGGQEGYNFGGYSMVSGDFNADGKTDLAVGTPYFSSEGTPNGRLYIFYADGSIPVSATSADVVITGSGNYSYDFLGWNITAGDFNADGKTDLVAAGLSDIWIFHNDGSYPDSVSGADFHITGNRGSAGGILSGDFNADGRTDLAVGDAGGGTNGRVCIFLFDSSVPTTLDTADVILSGETPDGLRFGGVLEVGDFNADGKTDLAVADTHYGAVSGDGRLYLFYNGSIATKNASAANMIIDTTNSNGYFGRTMTAGDFDADGRTDIAVGEGCSHTNWADGCAYIFYNDGSYPADIDSADVTIHGSTASDSFGNTGMASGDFNGDGKIDLAVTSVLGVNIFHNDGSYPADDSLADIRIAPTSNNGIYFGVNLVSADFNADGRPDIAIGDGSVTVNGYDDTGAVSIYTFEGGLVTGTSGSAFGYAFASGDFNRDGREDLAVSAPAYSSDTGRVYVFYGKEGRAPVSADSADAIITGTAGEFFGGSLASGDLNDDGIPDLVVGSPAHNSHTGRVSVFYGGSIQTEGVAGADLTFSGDGGDFGGNLAVGDFDFDGTDDLAVAATAHYYAENAQGMVFFFYNDGSLPLSAATADAAIVGENANDYFGSTFAVGDFDADGDADLAVGAKRSTTTDEGGRVYIFENDRDGNYPATADLADTIITGETDEDRFGTGWNEDRSLTAGDFNDDGRIDLAAGSVITERAYIFYNDGTYPASSADADDIIDSATTYMFGLSLAGGDLNGDGRDDVAACGFYHTRVFYSDGAYPSLDSSADFSVEDAVYGYTKLAMTDLDADGKTDLVIGYPAQDYVVFVAAQAMTVESLDQPVRARGPIRTRGQVRIR